jgi:hypothetical protein
MRVWLNVTVAVAGILLGRDRQRKWCVMTVSRPERIREPFTHKPDIASCGMLAYTSQLEYVAYAVSSNTVPAS